MMTTLQIVLALVGIALIGAVIVYNLVQERRFRKEADRLYSHKREDIMLGESVLTDSSRRTGEARIQLTGKEDAAPEARRAVEQAEAPEHSSFFQDDPKSLGEFLGGRTAPREAPAAPPPPAAEEEPDIGRVPPAMPAPRVEAASVASALDEETEYVARLKFSAPVDSYSGLLAGLRRIGKPVRVHGLREDGAWEVIAAPSRGAYAQLELGLQLADRAGALARDQLDSFCKSLYGFAADVGGAVICPDKEEALEQARLLDLFCMDVDVLMGLNVVAGEGHRFTSEAIHTLARTTGLVMEADGVYHLRDGQGANLFTLTNQEENAFPRDGRGLTTQGVTLLFDVPRVADGVKVFDRMTEFGFALAERLSGRLVDDNGRVVGSESLARDRARLQSFYARMEQRGIPAGGERAMRLFA